MSLWEWSGGCEPPTPGSCVGLSQSECYCQVSGSSGRIPLPLHSLPCRAGLQPCGSGISLHSTFLLPSECLHPLEVLTPAPSSPEPSPFLLPQHLLSTRQLASAHMRPSLFLTCGYQLAVMGGQGHHLCAHSPSRGSLARPTGTSWGQVPGEGRCPLTQPHGHLWEHKQDL